MLADEMSASRKKRIRKPAASKRSANETGPERRRPGGAVERAEDTRREIEQADRTGDLDALSHLVESPLPSTDGLLESIEELVGTIELRAPARGGQRRLDSQSARRVDTALRMVWEHPLLARFTSATPEGLELDLDEIGEECGEQIVDAMEALSRGLRLAGDALEPHRTDTYVHTMFPTDALDDISSARVALQKCFAGTQRVSEGMAAASEESICEAAGFVADPWEKLPPTAEELANYGLYLREKPERPLPVRRSDAELMHAHVAGVAAAASDHVFRVLALRGAETLRLSLALENESPEGLEPRIARFVPLSDSECRTLLNWEAPGTVRWRKQHERNLRWIAEHGEPELSGLARAELQRVVERGPYVTAGDRALEIAARIVRERWSVQDEAKGPGGPARRSPGRLRTGSPLTARERVVLEYLRSIPPDPTGIPASRQRKAICDVLSQSDPEHASTGCVEVQRFLRAVRGDAEVLRLLPFSIEDDEAGRLLRSLSGRGLVKWERGRGYWAMQHVEPT